MRHAGLLSLIAVLLPASVAVYAQPTTVIPRENVRYEHAHVLRVTPVYQVLTASRMEERCEGDEQDSRLSRVVGAVKKALKNDPPKTGVCRMVQVDQQFRRAIAYDVDYTYRGSKYRSRLAEDPGSLLRIRISVMPVP